MPTFSWHNWDSTNDPDNSWDHDDDANDGDIGTYAECTFDEAGWSDPLEFISNDPVLVSHLNFYVVLQWAFAVEWDVDIYYADRWNDLSTGSFTSGAWETIALSPPRMITKARFRWRLSVTMSTWVRLYELQYYLSSPNTFAIYNGFNSSGDLIDGFAKSLWGDQQLNAPIFFNKGLYVSKSGSGSGSFFVRYVPLEMLKT